MPASSASPPAPLVVSERLVDDAHAVVAAHGHEVGAELVRGLEVGDELLVHRRDGCAAE
jgi:hypothetical protein